MKYIGKQLSDWIVNKITAEYSEDICMLLNHTTLMLDDDVEASGFSYYIPATNRANGLARTFIIDGIGYDLFPISWERIERMADLKEYNTTCLGDAEIIYAGTEADSQRFEALKLRLKANLNNPQYMRLRAEKWLNTVFEIYHEMLFEDNISNVKMHAGYICDLLSISVAFVNGRYFKHGQTNQIMELSGMKSLPENFIALYEKIVRAQTSNEQKQLCSEIIRNTKKFILCDEQKKKNISTSPDFSELAGWYQELSYTWRRVYYWCDKQDSINAYIWCCMLQDEVNKWGKEFGIRDTDILGAYNAGDMSFLQKQARLVEQKFIKAINANGVSIETYSTIEDFLQKNA